MRPERGSDYRRNQKIPMTSGVDGFFASRNPLKRSNYSVSSRQKPKTAVKSKAPTKPKQLIKISMSLPGASEEKASRYSLRQASRSKLTKSQIIRRSLSGAVALLMLIGGGMALQFYLSLNQALHGDGETVAALQSNADQIDPNALNGEGSGRVNLLLLGRGGANHPGGDLTDTIMVASIDPINDDIALLSVPRDLWVDSPAGGVSKINAVYYNARAKALLNNPNDKAAAETAGMDAMKNMISEVTGLPINYYALFDFTAFKEAVDVVGGITVNVPSNLYDPSIAWENNNNPLIAKQGLQTMDGDQALLYVRSRKTSSDFARSERQRAVIEAIGEASKKAGVIANPIKLAELIRIFGNHFSSDLSIGNAQKLINIARKIDTKEVRSIGLTDEGSNFLRSDRVGDQSVVRPIAGFNNYDAIRSYVRNNIRDGYLVKEDAPILVLNGSSKDAKAGEKVADLLKSYGYKVTGVEQANRSYDLTKIVDLSDGKSPYTRHYLEGRLASGVASNNVLDSSIDTSGAQFVIIVGNE